MVSRSHYFYPLFVYDTSIPTESSTCEWTDLLGAFKKSKIVVNYPFLPLAQKMTVVLLPIETVPTNAVDIIGNKCHPVLISCQQFIVNIFGVNVSSIFIIFD